MAEEKKLPTLHGKIALVTGASRGIGAAAAIRLAQGGAAVVVNYHQNQQAAQKVLGQVEAAGARGMIFQADVTQRVADRFDGATLPKINSAPSMCWSIMLTFHFKLARCMKSPGKSFIRRSTMNCRRSITVCKPACRHMKEKKAGKIIVVSTRLAQQPLPRMGAYAAAKSALESMANTMAIELGPLGIAVNVVTPAFTLTDASMIMPEAYPRACQRNPAAEKASLSRKMSPARSRF